MENYSNNLKKFILENSKLIDNSQFELLYNILSNDSGLPLSEYSHVTELLLKININPLEYMRYVPNYYAYNLVTTDHINIPSNCTAIYSYAFNKCNLKSIKLHDAITTINSSAFADCSSLANINLPKNSLYRQIAVNTFYQCTSLTNIEIPDNITTIERSAFKSCTSLKNITLPNSITRIGKQAFDNCNSLDSIFIPDSVMNIRFDSFPPHCVILCHKDTRIMALCELYEHHYQII